MPPRPSWNKLLASCSLLDLKDKRKLCNGRLEAITYKTYRRYVVRCSKCKSVVYGPVSRSKDIRIAYPQKSLRKA